MTKQKTVTRAFTFNGHDFALLLVPIVDRRYPRSRFHATVSVDGKAWLAEYVNPVAGCVTWEDAEAWADRYMKTLRTALRRRTVNQAPTLEGDE